MGVYSNIDLKEINEILEHYELGRGVDFSATMTGISNSNFKVILDSGEKVLLKVSNDKTIEQLQNEQSILFKLKKYQYQYSLHPFETIQGKSIYQHKGMYGVVFPFIDGKPPLINESSVKQIGMALGKLHSLEVHKEDLDKLRPHDLVGYGGINIADYAQSKHAAPQYLDYFNEVIDQNLHELPYELFPGGIIHGDLYFDNSLFKDDKIVTLIDFEQAGTGRFILDIGIALSGCCLNSRQDNLEKDLIFSFLAGYESARPLKHIEKEFLALAIKVGFFSISLWRIKRFYEGNLDESKKNNYIDLLTRAKNFSELNIEFY